MGVGKLLPIRNVNSGCGSRCIDGAIGCLGGRKGCGETLGDQARPSSPARNTAALEAERRSTICCLPATQQRWRRRGGVPFFAFQQHSSASHRGKAATQLQGSSRAGSSRDDSSCEGSSRDDSSWEGSSREPGGLQPTVIDVAGIMAIGLGGNGGGVMAS